MNFSLTRNGIENIRTVGPGFIANGYLCLANGKPKLDRHTLVFLQRICLDHSYLLNISPLILQNEELFSEVEKYVKQDYQNKGGMMKYAPHMRKRVVIERPTMRIEGWVNQNFEFGKPYVQRDTLLVMTLLDIDEGVWLDVTDSVLRHDTEYARIQKIIFDEFYQPKVKPNSTELQNVNH